THGAPRCNGRAWNLAKLCDSRMKKWPLLRWVAATALLEPIYFVGFDWNQADCGARNRRSTLGTKVGCIGVANGKPPKTGRSGSALWLQSALRDANAPNRPTWIRRKSEIARLPCLRGWKHAPRAASPFGSRR